MCCNVFECYKSEYNYVRDHFKKIFNAKHTGRIEVPTIYIGRNLYQKHVIPEEIDIALRIAQTEWCRLQDIVFCNNSLSYKEIIFSRELINMTFHTVIDSLQTCDCPTQKERYISKVMKAVNIFSVTVVRIIYLQDDVLMRLSPSSMDNAKGLIYQYFHLFLDIQYYLLVMDYITGQPETKLRTRITNLMEDLITISQKNYKRPTRQVFVCNCIRDLWLVINLFTEKYMTNNLFWEIFNALLQNAEPIFSLWLLKHISKLEAYNDQFLEEGNGSIRIKPNYTLLESKLKLILLNGSSDTIINSFKMIEPLLCNIWLKTARIEVYQIVWDYFSKRLNISNKNPIQNVLEFNGLIHTILWSPKNCTDDFELFLSMLVHHLREHPMHWSKMKGRIYSQLGPHKLKDLNELGITRVMLLFLSLSNINFSELSIKISSFLEHLPLDKTYTSLVWNIYVAFIIAHVKEGYGIEKIASLMLTMLDYASCEKLLPLVRGFILNFEHIINFSKNMQLHQWLLINTWLTKYMTICYYSDLKTTLDVLLYTLNHVHHNDSWSYWEPSFREYVYPSLKQLANSSTAPDTVGQLSGRLCILIPDITSECFNYFNSKTVPPNISCNFINAVLENYPNSFILTSQQELLVIQSWVKICFLALDVNENLINNVLKLDLFPTPLAAYIKNSNDPICALIEYLGSDIKQHAYSNNIIKLSEVCFGQTDKWLLQYLVQPDNEVIVFHIYTCMSLAFLHCGILLYDRNKSTSPLTKLVQVLLLPTTFLIGKPLHVFVLNAVKKTWHIFFEAIVKINNVPDTFLERTLRDMIAKYMHYFPILHSPIIKCFENESVATVVLDKICNLYLRQQVKEPEGNMLKVLHILTNVIENTTSVTFMKLILSKILYGLYEVIIFHPQRNVAANLVKLITCSPLFPQVKMEFNNSVLSITEKHLAFNTTNYFQLMYALAKFVPTDMKNLLGDIKRHISNVERMRGVGFDKNLRILFEKLETSVKVAK